VTIPRPPIELLDSEVDRIQKVWDQLRDRHQKTTRNYDAVEREIVGRFADEGFVVHVNWYKYAIDGVIQEGAAMPEVTIVGRCDPKAEFDHDRQVHEVTSNILELPGQQGVIKTDQGDAFRTFREGGGDHGHGHHH
jgi:hypothetical protein